MASQVSSLLQDQNLNIHHNGASVGGKVNVSSKATKKGLGGRKPLGDLSNSVKPSSNHLGATLKKQSSNTYSLAEQEVANASNIKSNASKKKSISTSVRRKVLSDISNSVMLMPNLNEAALKKEQKPKLNVVVEDKVPSEILEEAFLHDHNECIKAQTRAMDADEFLKILGLNGSSNQLETPLLSPSLINLQIAIPEWKLELDEIEEEMLFETHKAWKSNSSSDVDSPCGMPRSPNTCWVENEPVNFELLASP